MWVGVPATRSRQTNGTGAEASCYEVQQQLLVPLCNASSPQRSDSCGRLSCSRHVVPKDAMLVSFNQSDDLDSERFARSGIQSESWT